MTTRIVPAALLATLSLLVPGSAAAEKVAPVVRAVVYPDRALLTRSLPAACAQGTEAVAFSALPSGIDPSTLRAAARGGKASVEGVSLYPRVLEKAHSEQVRALDEQLQSLQDKSVEQQQKRQRALAQQARADGLLAGMGPFLSREAAAEKKPAVQTWTTALEAARELRDEAGVQLRAADAALRELQRSMQDLRARRGQLTSYGPDRVVDVEVLVRCGGGGAATVELSYMVGGVGWQPLYEARAQEEQGVLELSVLAQVTQGTGEAWNDVELALSTAVTRRDARPPEVQRLYVGATPQEDKKKVLVRRDEEISHLEAGSGAALQPAGAAAFAAEDQGLSVQLKVPGRTDLAGDGKPVRLLVEKLRLPASFKLVAVPKLLPFAVRRGEAANAARYPLLPGKVELFSGESFLGAAALPRTAQGDKIKLGFGVDETVKVKRVTLGEVRKDPGFLGKTRRLLYDYRVELASHAGKPIQVEVQEHIPVSQLDDVKVIVDEKTTKGFEHARDDGILTWPLKLAPREKKSVELHFAVEIPDSYEMGL